ncbi:MAG: PIN domain-containing protein [Candidatus Woesearchaeota archaeon]|nr:PIN domain-containing protein [Candidatus Woesearchaeota archaeon]
MTDIKCFDSSAWLSYYFSQNSAVKSMIDSHGLILTSSLSLFEIKKRMLNLKKDPEPLLIFMKQRSVIIMPTIEINEKAAEIAVKNKLGAMDSLIYTTSLMHEAELVTGDNDFRNIDNVKIIS